MSQLFPEFNKAFGAGDYRAMLVQYAPDTYFGTTDLVGIATYQTPWWPGGGALLGNQSTDGPIFQGFWYEQPRLVSGSHWRYQITGITRDQYGSVLPNCTIRLFRTATDELVWSTTSDPITGAYLVYTPFFEAHYVVAYNSGLGVVPDREGTTLNTLVGT